MTTLRWIANSSASAFHAAEALCRGQTLADAALAEILRESAAGLASTISCSGIPADTFWSHVTPLSAGIHNNRELADVTLAKTIGRGARHTPLVNPFATAFTMLENAYNSFAAGSLDQLELRSGPLREQWEAHGPELLNEIGNSTARSLIVEQADVLLVHPALGGGGRAHLAYNSIRIEAVLDNPNADLPETVRLAWLVAQLNNDLPMHFGSLPRDRAALIGALALIPLALAAAEVVELGHYDRERLSTALATWDVLGPDAETTAETLDDWWRVYQESRPAWPVALTALDRMLYPPTPCHIYATETAISP